MVGGRFEQNLARIFARPETPRVSGVQIKISEPDAKAFTSVRFAPLYDAVTTRVFPGLGGDRMALKLNGKDDRLTRQDFLALARTIGMSAGDAETAIADLTARVARRAQGLQLPSFAVKTEAAKTAQNKVIALPASRNALDQRL